MSTRDLLITLVLMSSMAVATSWGKPISDEKLAKRFNVTWQSIQYNKSVTVYNPKTSSSTSSISEQFSLQCEIEVKDENLIFGIAGDPTLTELQDGSGHALQIDKKTSRYSSMGMGVGIGSRYEGLRYRTRFEQPSGPDTWPGKVLSAIGVSSGPSNRPERVRELQPSRLTIRLDQSTIPEGTEKIGLIKGSFHVLTAESIEYIDVPFEPNEAWVQLTPDTAIRVKEAESTDSSYRFRIEEDRQQRNRGFGISVGQPLPERMVAGYEFIGPDGKAVHDHGLRGSLGFGLGGGGSGSGNNCRVEKIRYRIAVKPAHRQVAFELKDIPLPKP